jgi:hypothetical protein
MKIQDGGAISNLKTGKKVEEIKVNYSRERTFEFWINDECLSYLSLSELLDLRDEINKALKEIIK